MLVDKLDEECTETVDEIVLAHFTLCYFQWFLQSTLELVAIFFIFIGI